MAAFLNVTTVHAFDDGRAVGRLLAQSATSDVVDAHLVICAVRIGHDILTGDPDDIAPLTVLFGPAEGSWARRHSSAQNLARRCKIILLCEDPALTGAEIAAKVGCNPATVSKWRKRCAEHRLDGLIDQPRPGAARTIGDVVVEQIVIDTLESLPKDATHWSTRSPTSMGSVGRRCQRSGGRSG